uniref:phosphatidylinositol N-acetylglucosaminyltransferase n=1 Tax=Strigamia maritima TaxID=126957 RepID=T1JLR4_STRMM
MDPNNGFCPAMKHNICMVSDFFYPNTGGVESHIFQLSQCLIKKGHKVIVITHAYGNRKGIRYMTRGLKVYYLPFQPFYNQCIFPTLFLTGPLMRTILIREEITIVHGHSAFSVMANEAMIHANNLNLKTVFTDHSLFGFADSSAIITNKLLELVLLHVDSVICVSHVGKENTVLRAKLHQDSVYVIPNAVDSSMFEPKDEVKPEKKIKNVNLSQEITIIVLSRLVYRKGTDLLVELIPKICEKYPKLNFIIGGNGPKRIALEEMVERHELYQNVTLLGAVRHQDVRRVLNKGQIFLNTSLTEAYCMAIVEAACCGLQVVTTDVGGIPEVLPSSWNEEPGRLAWLAKPNVDDLMCVLEEAIFDFERGRVVSSREAHNWVEDVYNWENVTCLTQTVYDGVIFKRSCTLAERLRICLNGTLGRKVFAFLVAIDYLVLKVAEYFLPEKNIDRAFNFQSDL